MLPVGRQLRDAGDHADDFGQEAVVVRADYVFGCCGEGAEVAAPAGGGEELRHGGEKDAGGGGRKRCGRKR